jgi:hypothetical protein
MLDGHARTAITQNEADFVEPRSEGCSMAQERDHINASDVGTYLFCNRAWAFERQGAPSEREPERARGIAYHEQHAQNVVIAENTKGMSSIVLVAGIILISLALLALVFRWG